MIVFSHEVALAATQGFLIKHMLAKFAGILAARIFLVCLTGK